MNKGVHIGDGSNSVVEEVTVGEVARQIIVNDDVYQQQPRRRQYAAPTVLRTNDFLKGRPRVHVPTGRERPGTFVKIAPGEEEVDEGPPRLVDPDGSYATPSMRPHFRVYADATLRKADQIFQGEASTSRSAPTEEELVAEDESVHQLNEEVVTGEELEQLMEESNEMDEQQMETLEPKHDMYYETGDEQSMRTDEYDEQWTMYANQAIDFPEACDIILGNTPIQDNKVCKSTPQGYRGIGTVIIDCDEGDRQTVGQDGLGLWGKPSGRTRFYQMNMETNKYQCVSDARGQMAKGAPYDVKCQLRKYEHPATTAVDGGANRFIKKIISCVSKDNEPVSRLVIITYEWVGTPFDFSYTPEPPRNRPSCPPLPQGVRSWEAASIQSSLFSSFPSTCTAMMGDCPLFAMGAVQFQDVASIIMGGTIVDESKICDRIPQRFRECGTFIIDVTSLGSEHELRRDNNGLWGKPAGNSRYYKYDGVTATRLDRCGKLDPGARAEGSYDLQVLCKRYEHPATGNRFVRKIYTGRTPVNGEYHETLQLAVITYFWKGEPVPFEILPQRKVRMHNASDIEMYKRETRFDGGMEEAMMGITETGETVYMEHVDDVDQSGMTADDLHARLLEEAEEEPPTKRRKRRDIRDLPSTSMATDERLTMQQDTGDHYIPQSAPRVQSEEDMQYAKMALENQERFSMLLDRFESVAEKMERMAEMQMNMMWRNRQYDEARGRPEGDVQYVEEEEEVYEVEGESGGVL